MSWPMMIGYLLVGAAGLKFGADWLVSGSSRLALGLGVKPLVIGLTLVAWGTSAPEMTVSVASAMQGQSDLAVGNVVGSNIANIGLILGLAAVIRPMPVEREMFRRDLPMMLAAAVMLAVLPFFGGPLEVGDGAAFELGRAKGAVLLAGLAIVTFLIFRGARDGLPAEAPAAGAAKPSTARYLGLALLGLVVLVAGGKLFVDGSVELAKLIGVPELVIGLTVVAVGTSLPELMTSMVATIKGEAAISLGNVVGSNIFNIFAVLGVAALVQPVTMDAAIMRMDMPVMLLLSFLLVVLAWRGRCLGRTDGVILLGLYALYVANLFGQWLS